MGHGAMGYGAIGKFIPYRECNTNFSTNFNANYSILKTMSNKVRITKLKHIELMTRIYTPFTYITIIQCLSIDMEGGYCGVPTFIVQCVHFFLLT